jgi:hypothetical protein
MLILHVLAPFTKDVGLKFDTVQYNGSFFKETAFRKDAGPEVDAAWKSLGVDCQYPIPMLLLSYSY